MLTPYPSAIHHSGDLWHADTGHDASGANRAGSHPHFHGVGARIDQRLRGFGGRDIASDDLHAGEHIFGFTNRIDDALRVPVRGVDDQHVDACLHQCIRSLQAVRPNAEGGPDAETAERILDRVRIPVGLQQVLDGDQAYQLAAVPDHEEFLDSVLVQQLARLGLFDPRRHRDELLRHELRDLLIEILLKSHVTTRQNAHRPVSLDHRQTRDLVPAHQLEGVVERHPRPYRDRVDDHTGLGALHLRDLERLMSRAHVLVQDADAAFTRHRYGGAPLGNCVHRTRDERNPQLQLARKARRNVRVGGQEIRVPRLEQHVIKGERFPQDAICHRNLRRT